MDYFYLVIFPNGKRGVGIHSSDAVEAALGPELFKKQQEQANRAGGFEWTAYVPRTLSDRAGERQAPVSKLPLRYETCSVSYKGEQLYEVFRSQSPEAIKRLIAKYGYTKQSTGVVFAFNAKPKVIPSKSKGPSVQPSRKVRTPPRRLD